MLIVTGNDPASVGVPDSAPSAPKARPLGSVPVSLHVNGATPPVAVKLYPTNGEFSVPTVGDGVVLIEGGCTSMAKF
jgi:hypothetical protein